MIDIADKIYAATGLTVNAETAAAIERLIQAENEKLRDAINAALTEETPMEDGLWSQEPIGPNETPAEAIKRLIKFRVNTGCIVERDAFKDEIEKLRAALTEVMVWINEWEPAFIQDGEWRETKRMVRAALGKRND
jgi:hypothetical protein